MRKLLAKGFVLELVSIVALLLSVVLSWVGLRLKLPTETIISASIGIAVAAYIWALKWEIKREIDEKVSLYTLLEKIDDEELYKKGKEAIEKCRVELDSLAKGIMQLDVGQLYKYMIQVTKSPKKCVRVTQIIPDKATLDRLLTFLEKPWYKHNVSIAKYIVFERLFIVPRDIALQEGTDVLQTAFQDVLEKQDKDGIEVIVVWLDDIETPEHIQDFAIVDDNVVIVTTPSWAGGYNNVLVYRKQYDIERYLSIFEALKSKGRELSDLKK